MAYSQFMKYLAKIKQLPQNRLLQREDVFNIDFLISEDEDIKEYYAPFDYINQKAEIMIVGITPGWEQTRLAYGSIISNLNKNSSYAQLLKKAKYDASFGGSMRYNLNNMLNGIGIPSHKLFDSTNSVLHATSLLRYPIVVSKKNYSGYFPSINHNNRLQQIINDIFLAELKSVKKALIIPLGTAVSKVISGLISKGLVKNEICLIGFPHPSNRNVHRLSQYNKYKDELRKKAEQWMKNSVPFS